MNINLDDYIDSSSNYIYYKTILKKLLFLYYTILGIITIVTIITYTDLNCCKYYCLSLFIIVDFYLPYLIAKYKTIVYRAFLCIVLFYNCIMVFFNNNCGSKSCKYTDLSVYFNLHVISYVLTILL